MVRPSHLFALITALCLAGPSAGQGTASSFSAARLSRDVRVLASDAFQGRAPGSIGEEKATAYIVRQFKAAGLKPAGTRNPDGSPSWFQTVSMQEFTLDDPVRFEIDGAGGTTKLVQGDTVAIGTKAPVDHIRFKKAPLIFVGYGIADATRQWDDFKGIDLHGKIAVVLVNDPDFETDMGGLFGGRTMTFFGRYTYKFAEMERRGALGVLVVHEPVAATIPWISTRTYFSSPRMALASSGEAQTLIEGWIAQDAAEKIFRSAGLDYAAEKKKAASRSFRPVPMGDLSLSADMAVTSRALVSRNVIGLLPGHARPQETVVYSAHWDHLGLGAPDARGDRIYNGAQDNAAGVADLLELARRFARAPKTERSLVFLALTGEEKGLMGSQTYVRETPFPLAQTIADLNIDALDIKGPTRDVSLWGRGDVSLESDLADIARARGRVLAVNPRFEVGYYFRSDHFSFARAGVPAITLGSGLDMLRGGLPAGEEAERQYFDTRYHHPGDEWNAALDFSGQAYDLELYYALGRRLADSDARPSFGATSEYRAAQDALRAVR